MSLKSFVWAILRFGVILKCAISFKIGLHRKFLHLTSLKSSQFNSLSEKCIQKVNSTLTITEIKLNESLQSKVGIFRSQNVNFNCNLYSSKLIKYARTVSFYGAGYDVLNFIIVPSYPAIQPILGIDLVNFNNKSIIAIDFQALSTDFDFTNSRYYDALSSKYEYWNSVLSSPTAVPIKYNEYFSPMSIFLRLNTTSVNWDQIDNAVCDYLDIYLDCVRRHDESDINSNCALLEKGKINLEKYLDFRIQNDPAANMLNIAFGKEWTSTALTNAVFPIV